MQKLAKSCFLLNWSGEHQLDVNDNNSRKLPYLLRKPDKTEEEEPSDACPYCEYLLPQTKLDCPDCKNNIPYCIITVSMQNVLEMYRLNTFNERGQ